MKFVFPFVGFIIFSLFISSVCAQEPIENWIIPTPTSLQVTNGSMPSQITISSTSSTNTYNIATAPKIVLLPCGFDPTLSLKPYISVEVQSLSTNGTTNTNSSIILGYATNNNTYEFEVVNALAKAFTSPCPGEQTAIQKYINGIASGATGTVACYTKGSSVTTGNVGAELQLEIVLNGTQYELRLNRRLPPASNFSTISTMNITPGDGRFYIKLKHKNTSAAAVENTRAYYPCTNSAFFNELKPSLDGGFAALYDDKLRIKYIQNYATINAADPISYTIRNWNNSVNINGTFDATYGINWIAVSLDGLPTNEFYTIEVVGNKGEKSYLRFKR